MVDNDIYDSKGKYEKALSELSVYALPPDERPVRLGANGKPFFRGKSEYWCKHPNNTEYFKRLAKHWESKDLSFVRRLRLFQSMRLICHATEKDLSQLGREDIDTIVAFMHTRYNAVKSKQDFVRDIKTLWKILFPERDPTGRIEDAVVPYAVRHLSGKMDKSKEKRKQDKLTQDEIEKILTYFSNDPVTQLFVALSFESLGRPQEMLYTRIRDVELYDNYAKIWISEHGKEGTGFLQCIESYPTLIKWLEVHPFRKDPKAYLFIHLGNKNNGSQLTPFSVNKRVKTACARLNISKPITCYSLKRNGVTYRRLRGDSDAEIQHAARWTSTDQLKTYDLSEADESLKIALAKKGLLKDSKYADAQQLKTKNCMFCDTWNDSVSDLCVKCKRPLDRQKIIKEAQERETLLDDLKREVEHIKGGAKSHLRAEEALVQFMQIPQIRRLFKTIYTLESRISKLEKPRNLTKV